MLDKIAQKGGLFFEDLRVEKGTKHIKIESIYIVDDIFEDKDVTLIDLKKGLPVAVEINDVFKKANLSKGNKIKAVIHSKVDVNGMTSEWNFKSLKKV